MNDVQQKLIEMKKNIPDCTSSRQRLRSILSDYFPTEKQLINSILNAYDEDIESKLRGSADRTLMALQIAKTLQMDYGLTATSAYKAVESWCYILGYNDVACAVSSIIPTETAVNSTPQKSRFEPIVLACGKYTAGVDFPAGDIRLKLISLMENNEQAQRQGVYYAILRKGGSAIVENGFIKKQATLPMREGQRLEIGWQGEVELSVASEVK